MNLQYLLTTSLFLTSSVFGAIVQPWTTAETEEAIVFEAGKKTSEPLSEALSHLIKGISDQTFTKDFFDKIAKLEKEQFTGEFIDHWPNGKMKIKAYFKKGKVDGHVHGWFDDGLEAFKAFFYENAKVGIHIAFYPVGAPRCSLDRIARLLSYDFQGKLHGEQMSSEYDTRLKLLIRYRHGVLHGKKCSHHAERNSYIDEFYEEGKIIPSKTVERKKGLKGL